MVAFIKEVVNQLGREAKYKLLKQQEKNIRSYWRRVGKRLLFMSTTFSYPFSSENENNKKKSGKLPAINWFLLIGAIGSEPTTLCAQSNYIDKDITETFSYIMTFKK